MPFYESDALSRHSTTRRTLKSLCCAYVVVIGSHFCTGPDRKDRQTLLFWTRGEWNSPLWSLDRAEKRHLWRLGRSQSEASGSQLTKKCFHCVNQFHNSLVQDKDIAFRSTIASFIHTSSLRTFEYDTRSGSSKLR